MQRDNVIIDRREMLRIKLKSLATEAKYIRREEDRMAWSNRGTLREELREHRTGVVRWEARATSLAYGFIKGYTRAQVENQRRQLPSHVDKDLLKKVEAMVKRYGRVGVDNTAGLAQWWSVGL